MTSSPTRRDFLASGGSLASVGIAGCIELTRASPTAANTIFASWRGRDPTKSITLQWLTTSSASSPVTVRLTPEGVGTTREVRSSVAQFGPSKFYRHRAEPSNLKADTRYKVSVNGSDVDEFVRTAPTSVSEPIIFAEGGDIGTGTFVPDLHSHAAQWDPMFALVGGDLAYANGTDAKKWVRFLKTWHRHMRFRDRLIPLVAAIGNHEVTTGMHGSTDDAPFFYSLFDNTRRDNAYWAFDLGSDISVLLLDSNHTTEVPGQQTEWLEDALRSRADKRHLMAAYHVPAYPSAKPIEGSGRDRIDVRRLWPPLFDRFGLDVAFEHDDHTYKRTHPLRDGSRVSEDEGVVYVGDGAWGKEPREVKSPQERPYLRKSIGSRNVIRVELLPDGSKRFLAVDEDGYTLDEFSM